MTDPSSDELFNAVLAGDESAFEGVYNLYHQRARLIAWKVSHRADWIDDLLNEAWCRAFRLRLSYNPERPFLVWFGGILQNVYREHCRKSPTTLGAAGDGPEGVDGGVDLVEPEALVSEAELLMTLNDCVEGLTREEQDLVRWRFFEGQSLRAVAQRLGIAEATVRENRLPPVMAKLQRCLRTKGITDIFPFSTAHGPEDAQ